MQSLPRSFIDNILGEELQTIRHPRAVNSQIVIVSQQPQSDAGPVKVTAVAKL